jgi:capsular exopolysaccharide synthesis family protein
MPNLDPLDSSPPQDSSTSGLNVDWQGIIQVLRDKSWLIISCVVLALIAAAVYVQKAPRLYEAAMVVQVQQEDAKIVKAEQVVSEDMRGLDVLYTVADKLCNPALLQDVLATNDLLPPEGIIVAKGSKTLTREETIKQFARNVKTSLRRNTRLIDITVRNTDPRLAAQLANSLVENYLEQDALAQYNTTEGANTFLQQEAKLQDLNKRLTQSSANLIQARGNYDDSLKMSTNIEDLLAYPQVAMAPDVAQIFADVARHENDFVLIRQRYREKNPKYIVAAASLAGLKEQLATTALKVRTRIQESLRIAYQDALTSEQGLETQLHETETNAMQLSDSAVHFNLLAREVESDKAQYDSIISRLGETAVAALITPERIRVVQPASVPEQPVTPKVKPIFALALFAGLAAGLGFSFVLESVNSSIRTVDEAERYLALPVLGAIPRLPRAELKNNKLAACGDRDSVGLEIFQTLRTTLSLLGREEDRKTYLFTSALPDEGKTFVSVNYAASLAQQGLRTLLVDLDLRRPMIEELLTGKRAPLPGVIDYFLGRKKFDELCLQHKDIPKLFWIPGGSSVPNPLELLTRSDFQQLLNEGLAHFDRIIIDTVPLLPVSDALLLASKVQTVVVVARSGKTPRRAVERALRLLNKARAPIGGIVLNLMPNHLFKGDYYYSNYQ